MHKPATRIVIRTTLESSLPGKQGSLEDTIEFGCLGLNFTYEGWASGSSFMESCVITPL